jgi:hypothetical protein
MLTLDQSTLFYWTLSDLNVKKRKHGRAINDWASAIPSNAKPTSRATSQVSRAPSQMARNSRSILPPPSLTSGTSGSTAPSVLTNNVRIISHMAPASAKVKPEPIDIGVDSDAGLSDNDEINGNEREAAVNSPPKGKKRITSDVYFFFLILTATEMIYNCNTGTRSPKAIEGHRDDIEESSN